MALQIKNVLKSSAMMATNASRALSSSSSSGIFNGNDKNQNQSTNKLHLAIQREYPQAERLPIPPNIDVNETSRFSPLRNRDITASAIEVAEIDVTLDQSVKSKVESVVNYEDPHLSLYDARTPVNVGCMMQSTVPEPYGGVHKHSHLNMPGGSWGQQTKYLSHELNSAHYTQLRQEIRSSESRNHKGIGIGMCGISSSFSIYSNVHTLLASHHNPFLTINKRFISLNCKLLNEDQTTKKMSGESGEQKAEKETGQSKLKKAVKEYGSTVIAFHVAISLMSLGTCYVLVSSGLDVVALLDKLSLTEKFPKLAENASTFVIAYAIHKVFAPVRISITLGSTPFIVRFLRRKGILKEK